MLDTGFDPVPDLSTSRESLSSCWRRDGSVEPFLVRYRWCRRFARVHRGNVVVVTTSRRSFRRCWTSRAVFVISGMGRRRLLVLVIVDSSRFRNLVRHRHSPQESIQVLAERSKLAVFGTSLVLCRDTSGIVERDEAETLQWELCIELGSDISGVDDIDARSQIQERESGPTRDVVDLGTRHAKKR